MAKKKSLTEMPKIIVDFVAQKKPGSILFTFLILVSKLQQTVVFLLVSLDENHKQLEKSFPKIMKESHDLNIKETFQIFVVFSIKI